MTKFVPSSSLSPPASAFQASQSSQPVISIIIINTIINTITITITIIITITITITTVQDHTHILGDTIEKITREKAGICA
jgi:hypothetical protein